MQLRRFTAESTPAALGAVRLALGDDAIILANRRLGDMVEIIATGQMDDGADLAEVTFENLDDSQHSSVANGDDTPVIAADSTSITNGSSTSLYSGLTDDKVSLSSVQTQKRTPPVATDRKVETSRSGANSSHPVSMRAASAPSTGSIQAESGITSARLDKRAGGGQPTEIPDSASVIRAAFNETLNEQMALFKAHLSSVLADERHQTNLALEAQGNLINSQFKGLDVKLWGNTAPNRTAHLQGLFALGIGAELAIQLVERADPDASIEDSLRHSFALLKTTLPIANDKTFSVPGVTLMSGPPGSGKTTALVKLATQHIKSHSRDSIVIICADTRRIGAFEELQAYGRLLGVPTVHAHDKSELASLLDAFTHKQLVLIDHTLPLAEGAVELPHSLLEPAQADTVRHLFTLSANSQASAIDALIAEHCRGRKMQCVLTQLDTSARLGELFNPLIRHHLPIAYWSDSASVQSPLQKADASILVATAAAMSRRIPQSADDQWLNRLIQPSDRMMEDPLVNSKHSEVSIV